MHIPVLLKETVELLSLKGKKVFVDATLWLWWHTKYVLETYPDIFVIAIDQDEENLEKAKKNLSEFGGRIEFVKNNFANLQEIVESFDLAWKVDWLLLDLWLASTHIDNCERWFSFRNDWPLDMRMDLDQSLTAEMIVNTYKEQDLYRIFKEYWEDPRAKPIAREIVSKRKEFRIKTTHQLVDIIKSVKKDFNKHPATLVFQALRIEVNSELEVLKKAIIAWVNILVKWWIIAVMSYHSLEDRIVKNCFRFETRDCICPIELVICQCKKVPSLDLITKKPIIASEDEIKNNLRSRSVKLRVARKIV